MSALSFQHQAPCVGLPVTWYNASTYDDNLMAAHHVRYGRTGGIAYRHIDDNYVALFSYFIPCGVHEAFYILDGLFKNTSDVRPSRLHADTHGQSTVVFALAYLLDIELMPRIRHAHVLGDAPSCSL